MGFVLVDWSCSCGKHAKVKLRQGPLLEDLRKAWKQRHSGPGHEPIDAEAKATAESLEDLRALIERATSSEPPL